MFVYGYVFVGWYIVLDMVDLSVNWLILWEILMVGIEDCVYVGYVVDCYWVLFDGCVYVMFVSGMFGFVMCDVLVGVDGIYLIFCV